MFSKIRRSLGISALSDYSTRHLLYLTLVLLGPVPVASAAVELTKTELLSIETAVAASLSENPGLSALEASATALSTRPSQVGALPDPVLSLNAMNLPTDSFDFDQEPMTQLQIAISQRLPFPGKRKLKREASQHVADAAARRNEEQRDVLTGMVRSTWWQLFAMDRARNIIEKNKQLLGDFVKIAKAKYAVGTGLQQDVLLAQLEFSRLQEREVRLSGRRLYQQSELNRLMGRSPHSPIIIAQVPPNESLPGMAPIDELINQAFTHRDYLTALASGIAAAEKRVELADRERYPDFNVGIGYGERKGTDPLNGDSRSDFVSLMFSMNLPIYSRKKQSQAISQRISERDQLSFALEDSRRLIETEIGQQLASYDAARGQATLLKGTIVPQAEQTISSMLAGYEVNKVDFLNVVNGQIMLYNARINYWYALSDAKQSLAKLAAAVGKESIYE